MEILDKTGVSVLWTAIKNKFALKSSLSTVATSGSYNDLTNKPYIPSVSGYLPLSGGTLTGNLNVNSIGDTATSSKITFNGSTDGADIYYQTTAADQGNLVLNLRDDDNCYLRIAQNGNFKSYFAPSDGSFHGNVVGNVSGNATTASGVAWANVTGKPSTFTPSSHTHTLSQITDAGAAASKAVKTATTVTTSGWTDAASADKLVPTMSFIAYWNGAYSNSSSNLAYCNKGAFGTAATKNTGDFAAASHTHTWAQVTGKPTLPTNITATASTIVNISGSTITVNASLDNYKTPGEFNIYGTSNGDYAKMYVQSGIADTFNDTRVITQTIRVTISHNTYAEVCDVTRQYKSNAWSAWTIMYLGND